MIKYWALGGGIVTALGLAYMLRSKKTSQQQIEFTLLRTTQTLEYNTRPAGIINKGSTCFLNSVLQYVTQIYGVALSSQPNFVEYLFDLVQHFSTDTTLNQQICLELARIMKLLHSDLDTIDAISLIDLLTEDTDYLFFYQQQDSHELFNMLMRHIEEASNEINALDLTMIKSKQPLLKNPFLHHTKVQIKCNTCQRSFNLLKVESNYAFHFQLSHAQTIQQAIQYLEKPETISDYICIYCSLNLMKAKYKLPEQQKIIDSYLAKNYFEDDTSVVLKKILAELHLEEARVPLVKRVVTKKTEIAKYPKTFCFFVNRLIVNHFGQYEKLSDPVYLDPEFTISEKKYSLSAVVCHLGGSNQGHYVAYKRTFVQDLQCSLSESKQYKKCEWYLTSDTHISPAKEPLHVPAYLIFYDTN